MKIYGFDITEIIKKMVSTFDNSKSNYMSIYVGSHFFARQSKLVRTIRSIRTTYARTRLEVGNKIGMHIFLLLLFETGNAQFNMYSISYVVQKFQIE